VINFNCCVTSFHLLFSASPGSFYCT
jgi:hypothetical protein